MAQSPYFFLALPVDHHTLFHRMHSILGNFISLNYSISLSHMALVVHAVPSGWNKCISLSIYLFCSLSLSVSLSHMRAHTHTQVCFVNPFFSFRLLAQSSFLFFLSFFLPLRKGLWFSLSLQLLGAANFSGLGNKNETIKESSISWIIYAHIISLIP